MHCTNVKYLCISSSVSPPSPSSVEASYSSVSKLEIYALFLNWEMNTVEPGYFAKKKYAKICAN